MAEMMDKESRLVALQLGRVTGLKTAYGSDHFKNIGVYGPFVRVDVGGIGRKASGRKAIATRFIVLKILERFYKRHLPVEVGSHLILRNIGVYGDFLIVNQNSDVIGKLPVEVRKKLLTQHAKEFGAFAKFLSKAPIR